MDTFKFIPTLLSLGGCTDNRTRESIEARLLELAEQQPGEIARQLTQAIGTQSTEGTNKLMILAFLGGLIKVTRRNQSNFWAKLDPDSRKGVIDGLFGVLIDPSKAVRGLAARVVGETFVLEAIWGQNPVQILGALTTNMTHENPTIRETSALVVEAFTEVVETNKLQEIPGDVVEALLTAIFCGLQSFQEDPTIMLRCLGNAARFSKAKLGTRAVLEPFLEALIRTASAAAEKGNMELFNATASSLKSVVKSNFGNMDFAIHQLVHCLGDWARTESLPMRQVVLGILKDIFKAEKSHRTRFLSSYWQEFSILAVKNVEDVYSGPFMGIEDEEKLALVFQCVDLLGAINRSYYQAALESTFQEASRRLQCPVIQDKTVCLCLIRGILESVPTKDVGELLSSIFVQILQTVVANRSDGVLVGVGVLLVEGVSQFHPQVVVNPVNFIRFLEFCQLASAECIKSPKSECFCRNLIESLANLVNFPSKNREYEGILRSFGVNLLQLAIDFLMNVRHQTDSDLATDFLLSLSANCVSLSEFPILIQFGAEFLDHSLSTVDPALVQHSQVAMMEFLTALVCFGLSNQWQSLLQDPLRPQAEAIFQTTSNLLKTDFRLLKSGIPLLSVLLEALAPNDVKMLGEIAGHLELGLREYRDLTSTVVCVGALLEITTRFGSDLGFPFSGLVESLVQAAADKNSSMEDKVCLLQVLPNAIGLGLPFEPFKSFLISRLLDFTEEAATMIELAGTATRPTDPAPQVFSGVFGVLEHLICLSGRNGVRWEDVEGFLVHLQSIGVNCDYREGVFQSEVKVALLRCLNTAGRFFPAAGSRIRQFKFDWVQFFSSFTRKEELATLKNLAEIPLS